MCCGEQAEVGATCFWSQFRASCDGFEPRQAPANRARPGWSMVRGQRAAHPDGPDSSAGGDTGACRDHSPTTGRPGGRSSRTVADGRCKRLSPGRIVPPSGRRLSHCQQPVDACHPGRPGAEPDAARGGSGRLPLQAVAVAGPAERPAAPDRPACGAARCAGHPGEPNTGGVAAAVFLGCGRSRRGSCSDVRGAATAGRRRSAAHLHRAVADPARTCC